MLRALCTKIVVATLLALFAFVLARPLQIDIVLPRNGNVEPFLPEEGTVRSERSANISHIIGVSRKIQLIVNKIMYLQISPDGSVNGTDDDNDYTILQRASLNNYQIKIQGVVTCNFLCMDRCGLLYGSKEFTDDCIFNEMMESHHFNTYSSAKYSNDKRTLYLALNKKGIPRKVQTKAKAFLGKMEAYTNVLTKPVSPDRVEGLAVKIAKARVLLGKYLHGSGEEGGPGGNHLFRHHRYQFCPNVSMIKSDEKNSKLRCRKKEKRKKKRKCRDEDDEEDDCFPMIGASVAASSAVTKKTLGKCEEDEDEEECQKRLHGIRQKRKSRIGSESDAGKCSGSKCADDKERKRKKRVKGEKKKIAARTSSWAGENISRANKSPKVSSERPGKEIPGTSRVPFSGEDLSTASLLWRDASITGGTVDSSGMKRNESEQTAEKFGVDYEDDELTDKMAEEEEEEEETSAETEMLQYRSSSFSMKSRGE